MSALTLVLTTAGRDALINAQNTGVSNVVIAQIGLGTSQVALSAATTAIPDEVKRLGGVGGQIVAPETFYVSATDTSADTYAIRTIALYLSDGTLLGAYSQASVLLDKAAPAMAVIEAAVRLLEPLATEIEFTGGGWNNPPASEAVEGILRIATQVEVNAGSNDRRAVTPKTLKARLDAVLAGLAPVGHTHDAAAIVSGVLAVARIPELAMSKVTGLVDALAAKAAAVHYHAIADVTGLVNALALKVAIADFTWTNLGGKPALWTMAALPDPVTRSAVDTMTGRKVAKSQVDGSLQAQNWGATPFEVQAKDSDDAAVMSFHIPNVIGEKLGLDSDGEWRLTRGGTARLIWHAGNFNPADKANALHSHDWAQVLGKPSWTDPGAAAGNTGVKYFLNGGNAPIANGTTVGASLEVRGAGGLDGAAFMGFHRPGQFAAFFGVDIDNEWKVGGWSMGAFAYRVWHDANARATSAGFRANSSDQALTPNNVWAAAQLVAAAQAGTIAIDLAAGLNFSTTMTGNRTLGAPANAKPGQSGVIQIIQDGAGGRTLGFDAAWKFPGGAVPQLSAAANARDILVFTVIAPGDVAASLMKDVRR